MQCQICGGSESREVFRGQVRAGAPGVLSDESFGVLECATCSVQWLSPFPPDLKQFYETEEYRDSYNQSRDQEEIAAMHVDLRVKVAEKLNLASLFGKTVADFGCGDGGLLNLVAGVAKKTIAIEPTQFFHEHLRRRGHQVFPYGRDLVESGQQVDVATSFAVVEHVPDPLSFVAEMYEALAPGGRVVLSTPNTNEVLSELTPDAFERFNYRTAHLYYFNEKSLQFVLQKVGFKSIRIGYQHVYDLSNLLGWYKEGKPTGLGRIPLFDEQVNSALRRSLEETGRASDLWVEAVK